MEKGKSLFKTIGTQRLVAVIALIAIYLFFFAMSPAFRSTNTLVSIFDSAYATGFMAIGVTFVIITGGIDLSIGTVLICTSLIGGTLYNHGVPLWISLIVIILSGALFGLANGIMVSVFKLPAFIATLGTMMVTRGLGSIITKTQSITFPLRTSEDGWYKSIFRTADGFPVGIILLVVAAIIMAIFLGKTRPGRYILSLGSNKEATRLSGVNIVKWETLAYVISGTFAGIAGIAYAAINSTIMPGTGNGFELDAIAAVVIGGTSLAGGYGTVVGTIIGVFIMAILKVGLPFIDLQPHYQQFITGFVLIVAVYLDVKNRNKKKTR
ncbi:ribose ABC transporter permease [Sporanaerobium hydrogeniformans]|uniref:Ribose ABC transporter permease n=1 Tax=Sporanaerobium hydrogeniformans TaxID=3072179 RepID=A0AC61DAG1_9FIRM|nr:ABC transporter permease [Sporanaerobium hydrogeniformans]PHV70279.1 ribose ABC transporter permease [Sporanaerobium hydrogeniformans]